MAQAAYSDNAGIGFGTGNEPGLPPVNLPSTSMIPPAPEPLKLTIPNTKGKGNADFWDSLPDAEATSSDGTIPQNAPQSAKGGNTTNFWDSLPDAPPEPPKQITLGQDISQTLAKNTIPDAVVGRVAWPLDIVNLGKNAEGWIGARAFNLANPKFPLSQQEETQMRAPVVPGTSDIVQGAEHMMGIEPYEPKYDTTKFANTVATTALTRKPVGAPALSLPQALSMGAGAGGAQLIAPDSPFAPLVGGLAAAAAHQPIAAGFQGVKNAADNMGIGRKAVSISPDISATQGQMQQAAQNVYGAASNPQNLVNSISQGAVKNNGQWVIGSRPTMAEVTPDQGIAQYQDAARTGNPAPFQQRTGEQNTARTNTVANMVGKGNPQNIGQFFSAQLQAEDAAAAAKESQMQASAQNRGEELGKYGDMPQEGATRDKVQNAQGVRKEGENSAWGFMDAYQNSPADLQTARAAAKSLLDSAKEYGAAPLTTAEENLVSELLNKRSAAEDNFGALKRFRTRIGDAIKEVGYGTEAARRLSILKNSIDKAIENTVNGIIEHENQAIKSGTMLTEDTFAHNFASAKEGWYNSKYAAQARNREASANASSGHAGGRREAVSGVGGAGLSKERVSGGREGSESMSPAFGEEQQRQYKAAQRVTFQNKVLTDLENSGIIDPDGTINPQKYDRWYLKNRNQFKNHPEFQQKLSDWRNAQKELEDFRAVREEQQKDYQKSRAAKFTGGNDPVAEIGKIFGNKATAQKEFSDLINKAKGDKAAMAGIKAAVGEHILNIAKVEREEVEGATVGKIRREQTLRDFIRTHRDSLREIYGNSDDLAALESVASDIKRTQNMYERAKLKGQSNTTKDTIQFAKQVKLSILERVMAHAPVIGGAVGALFGHLGGGLWAGEIGKVTSAFHSRGINTVKALELEMLMHPATFGKAMLEQVKSEEVPLPLQRRIASMVIKAAPQEAITSSNRKKYLK